MLGKLVTAALDCLRIYRKKLSRPQVLVAIDFFSIFLASAVAYKVVEVVLNIFGYRYESWSRIVDERGSAFVLTCLIVVGWLYFKGTYHQKIPFWDATKNLVVAGLLGLMIEGFALYAYKSDVSRLLTFVTWMIVPIVTMSFRRVEQYFSHKRGIGISSVVVVGCGNFAANAKRLLESDAHLGFRVVGVEEPSFALNTEEMLKKYPNVSYVLVALSGSDGDENQVVSKLRSAGVDLIVVPVPNGPRSGDGSPVPSW